MEKRPFFSVIIPFHNAEKYLKSAVCSVSGQTFSDLEILLVDDASTDHGREKALKLAGEDGRIRLAFLEKNVGAGEARNIGIRRASGEYLLFLDADDVFEEDLLEQVYASLQENPAQAVIWGLVEEYRNARQELVYQVPVSYPARLLRTKEEVRKEILPLELKSLYGYFWNKAYQREYLQALGISIPTQAFNEDIMFNLAFFMDVSSVNILGTMPSHYSKRVEASLTNRYMPDYYRLAMGRVEGLLAQQQYWGMDTPEVRTCLAGLYLRYLASALERNCDSRGGMGRRERRSWMAQVIRSELCGELLPYARPDHPALRMLASGLRRGNRSACLLAGRVLHQARVLMPGKFNQLKGKK